MNKLQPPLPYKTMKQYAQRYVSADKRNEARVQQINSQIKRAETRLRLLRWQQRCALSPRKKRLKQLRSEKELAENHAPSWIESILKPIAKDMLKHLPNYSFEISGPFGTPANTSIFFRKEGVPKEERYNGENSMFIGFRPLNMDSSENTLGLIDYATSNGPPDNNDLHHPTRPITPNATVLDLLTWMKNQHRSLSKANH